MMREGKHIPGRGNCKGKGPCMIVSNKKEYCGWSNILKRVPLLLYELWKGVLGGMELLWWPR